jgi:hypothetical protein
MGFLASAKPPNSKAAEGLNRDGKRSQCRFPLPWSVEDNGACFIVKDGGGQKLAYVYYEEEHGRRSAAKLLTKDEAWRIAVNFAATS